ncbi:hypothetical protein HAX54_040968 [Datura stramonium]|uniref:Uncharacterized protein n=1 Tax=Datura stramonium TaxID=4076 RepID=A0ABS8VTI0_DATST|nr:hypothetical protein [Datura stramonium]
MWKEIYNSLVDTTVVRTQGPLQVGHYLDWYLVHSSRWRWLNLVSTRIRQSTNVNDVTYATALVVAYIPSKQGQGVRGSSFMVNYVMCLFIPLRVKGALGKSEEKRKTTFGCGVARPALPRRWFPFERIRVRDSYHAQLPRPPIR